MLAAHSSQCKMSADPPSRAGAATLPAEAEMARVVPAIAAVRAALGPSVPISVDTFYAAVATAAVAAGANCINDVSGGTLEPAGRSAKFAAVSALCVPYVAMHTRGSPATMASLASYGGGGPAAEAAGVLTEVRSWLADAAAEALSSGMLRWNLILDPGLGFAKAPVHSFALLSPAARSALGDARYPLLYGPSRKGFLGAATGKAAPSERGWATAAAVTASIAAGADIVRVHDVGAMVDVARTADACFRGPFSG